MWYVSSVGRVELDRVAFFFFFYLSQTVDNKKERDSQSRYFREKEIKKISSSHLLCLRDLSFGNSHEKGQGGHQQLYYRMAQGS